MEINRTLIKKEMKIWILYVLYLIMYFSFRDKIGIIINQFIILPMFYTSSRVKYGRCLVYMSGMVFINLYFNYSFVDTEHLSILIAEHSTFLILASIFAKLSWVNEELRGEKKKISDLNMDLQSRIREAQKLENKLRKQSSVDELTQISNRRHIQSLLEFEIEKLIMTGGKLCVALLDIDNFKEINDKYGHLVGDEVLKRVSEEFRIRLRKVDSVGRYGGEEFLMIFPFTILEDAVKVLERLKDHISHFNWEPGSFRTTFSAGVVEINEASEEEEDFDIERILSRADNLLYMAKDNGRNRIEF